MTTIDDFPHSKQCQEAKLKFDTFMHQWPDACGRCNASGKIMFMDDPSPPGVSLASGYMVDCECCVMCLEDNNCPRCKHPLNPTDKQIDTETCICYECGWEEQDKSTHGPHYECYCWESSTRGERW